MAKNDARDDGTWYQLGFPEPEREEYLALHAESPRRLVRQIVGRCSRGLTFSYWSPTRFSVSASARSS